MTTVRTPAPNQPEARSWLERVWNGIAERSRAFTSKTDGFAPSLGRARALAEALLSEGGEASGLAIARELLSVMRDLPSGERLSFLRVLAGEFGPDPVVLRAAAAAYIAKPDAANAYALAEAAEPPRQELLRRMNMPSGGTAALVALRGEVLDHLRANPDLRPLSQDLQHLFGSWFNRGFLELRRIDWQTPAAILEKLIKYEAVHEIHGWEDLRRRLAADRRCFGFFHPALPDEPLIFIEVALTRGLAGAIQPLLALQDDNGEAADHAAVADSAIFYSISNCQVGLRGVSFGNFLIKQVVEELKAELPNLKKFSTLSPIPGFRRWLDEQIASPVGDRPLFSAEERAALSGSGAWPQMPGASNSLRTPLLRAAARFLVQTSKAMDPVARFHLDNGARVERINWLGNTAPRGLQESYGIMVNYLYDLPTIEANHEAFVREGSVAHSRAVGQLLVPSSPSGTTMPHYLSGLLFHKTGNGHIQ